MDEQQVIRLLFDASEQLRQSLNKIIKDLNLPPQIALSAIARVAAGYTHQFQRTLDDPKLKDAVEDAFLQNYIACLYDFDEHDVAAEIERLKNINVN